MMNEFYFGKITMTHGIKGELKLYTDFSLKEKVLKVGFPIYIRGEKHVITSVRPHKEYYLVIIDDLQDINLVESFRHSEVFIKESDLHLTSDEVILEKWVGYLVKENEEVLGKIRNIRYNKVGILLEVQNTSKFYIPYQKEFIDKASDELKEVYVKNVDGVLNTL